MDYKLFIFFKKDHKLRCLYLLDFFLAAGNFFLVNSNRAGDLRSNLGRGTRDRLYHVCVALEVFDESP